MNTNNNAQEYCDNFGNKFDINEVVIEDPLGNDTDELSACSLGEAIQKCEQVDKEDEEINLEIDQEIAQEIELMEQESQSSNWEHKYPVFEEMDPYVEDFLPADPNDDSEWFLPGKMIIFRTGFEPMFEFKDGHILCNDLNATIENLQVFISSEHHHAITNFGYIDASTPFLTHKPTVMFSQIKPFYGYKFAVIYYAQADQPSNNQSINVSRESILYYKTIKIAYTKEQKKFVRHPMQWVR